MHVIITHEQADFDALASLLGAHLLNDSSVPILPRRMNRNVRAFLTLYGMELPFVDPRDLTGERIDMVTLVDTQSLISLKGMTADMRVHVVDHHPPGEDLPEGWTIKSESVGATTTLLVEGLQERGYPLSPVEATLLILGVYEDTGSLTYARTTTRDLRAATFLVERGARLEIAADFLEHPLSPDQHALYEQLRAAAETHHIRGHTILMAVGDASELDEELSTIAHKLRDVLDPDGLFLIIATGGGVQIVARSTSDHIDVGAVAAHFRGGGHERAAAALVRDDEPLGPDGTPVEPETVREELLRILPDHVRPAITVSRLMSRGPQLIDPEMPVGEIAQRMQRYGYEGYPVVKEGRVVGLLTRRAVDRALAHRLQLTAGSLMKAGEVTVQTDDSLEDLQNKMIDTGWGQIPVVDPDSGEIVGIVTRTDLIKTLSPQPRVPGYQNLADRLENVLPPARLALLQAIAELADRQGAALYIVGGFVRDLLLERPSLDFDLVVEGDAIALAHALAGRYQGRITSHGRFGTAKWHTGEVRDSLTEALAERAPDQALSPAAIPASLDLVTARTEFYPHPTALPTVERGSIKLDLHRRDFTMNTLALRLDGRHYGELHDYWGGLNDLRQGLVRVLHSLSFVDDPTRMLRAVRFEQRFGFEIEDRTLELLLEARPLMDRVSGDRIRHELDAILSEKRAAAMMVRLASLGLLAAIHPGLSWDEDHTARIDALHARSPEEFWGLEPPSSGLSLNQSLAYILWLIEMPVAEAQGVIERLRLPNDLSKAVLAANRLHRDLPALVGKRPSEAVDRLENLPPEAIYTAALAAGAAPERQVLERFARTWRHVTPTITGHHLRDLEIPPGPVYRRILDRLRAAWLDEEISSEQEEATLLEEILREHART